MYIIRLYVYFSNNFVDIVMEHSDDVLSNILGKGINPKGKYIAINLPVKIKIANIK